MIVYRSPDVDTLDINTITNGIIAHWVTCDGNMVGEPLLSTSYVHQSTHAKYTKLVNIQPDDLLGLSQAIEIIKNKLYIVNCFTKIMDSTFSPYIPILSDTLSQLVDFAMHKQLPIYITKVGCTMGGLSWDEVEPILIAIDADYPMLIINVFNN
jgi:hypothetical protein